MEKFVNEDFDKIDIIYNKFKNAATQVVVNEQFLPISDIEEDFRQYFVFGHSSL